MSQQPIDLDSMPPAQAMKMLRSLGRSCSTRFAGGQICWHLWGEGPALVLLHGGYGGWGHWARVIQPLAERFSLLVPDMPGFGESDEPARPHTPEGIAEGLADGIDQILGFGARPHLAGFSFGGVIAGHLAAIRGERMGRLALVAPGGLGATRAPMDPLIPRTRHMSPLEVETAHRRNLEILMVADPARVDPLALYIQALNTWKHKVKSRPISATDTLAQALKRVRAPMTSIWGEKDATAIGYLDQREAILREIYPDLDFRVMPGLGHWVMYEAPDEFADLLTELLFTPD